MNQIFREVSAHMILWETQCMDWFHEILAFLFLQQKGWMMVLKCLCCGGRNALKTDKIWSVQTSLHHILLF